MRLNIPDEMILVSNNRSPLLTSQTSRGAALLLYTTGSASKQYLDRSDNQSGSTNGFYRFLGVSPPIIFI